MCVLLFVFKHSLLRKTDVLKACRKSKFFGKKIWRNALALKSKKEQGIFGKTFIMALLSSAVFLLQNRVSYSFTLEPAVTDLKLIRICFKTNSNNIHQFPTVYTRLWKRNNDYFQFSRLHLSMIMTGARWSMICASEISKILRF